MIGKMRARVGLYVPVITADDLGGSKTVWSLQGTFWAAIKAYNISESRENGRLAVLQPYKITIRYVAGFPERARLKWGQRILRVIAASDPDHRQERLSLICEEEAQ